MMASRRVLWGVWSVTLLLSIALLAWAGTLAFRHWGQTLRAMDANESMPSEQARQVAENTVRVWMREREAQHVANLVALTCKSPDASVREELDDVRSGRVSAWTPLAAGLFTQEGLLWDVLMYSQVGGSGDPNWYYSAAHFTLVVEEGQLRVCSIDDVSHT